MRTRFSRRAVVLGAMGGLATTAAPGLAQTAQAKAQPLRSTFTAGLITVEVTDYSPQFLAWYEAAQGAADDAARFALWQQLYGQAAVPPGPRGEAMARDLLAQAWPHYGDALPAARAGAAGMQVDKAAVLGAVAHTLELRDPARMQFTTIVGGFEANAYTYRGALPTLVIELETPPERLRLLMAHEGTHAVHMIVGNLSGGWERSIAATVLQEGLAMHVSREVDPGQPLEFYITNDAEWWARANAAKMQILSGMRPDLATTNGDAVMKYTIGPGNAGLPREGYAVGWWVVEALRVQGRSFGEIARIPEADMPGVVGAAMDVMLHA